MKKKFVIFAFASLILILYLSVLTSAITASIGNAKMILKAEVGDTIKKSVLVKNINNISVNISMSVSGDLEKDLILEENKFTLSSGEERDVPFTIKIRKPGTTTTKINIGFAPAETKGANVGLSSTIIVNAYGEGELPEDEIEDNVKENNNSTTSLTNILGNSINLNNNNNKTSLNFSVIIAITLTIILIVMLSILMVIHKNKIEKKINKKRK